MAYARKQRYWYRSVREGRRVRTEYLGRGPLAAAAAALHNADAERRECARREHREAREQVAAENRALSLLERELVKTLEAVRKKRVRLAQRYLTLTRAGRGV